MINGLEQADDEATKVFHAGTANSDGQVVTSGGRVLCVTGLGETVATARENAYRGVDAISWEGAFYRSDIGWRALERE